MVAVHLGRRWNLPCLLIWGNDAERARWAEEELLHFHVKPALVSETPDISRRERPYDDLVLALALACRQAERDWLHDEWLDHRSVPTCFPFKPLTWDW